MGATDHCYTQSESQYRSRAARGRGQGPSRGPGSSTSGLRKSIEKSETSSQKDKKMEERTRREERAERNRQLCPSGKPKPPTYFTHPETGRLWRTEYDINLAMKIRTQCLSRMNTSNLTQQDFRQPPRIEKLDALYRSNSPDESLSSENSNS